MSNNIKSRYSRRKFLQMSGTGLAAAGIGSAIQGCAAPPASPTAAPVAAPTAAVPTGMTLKMSWWGEQEAPGLEGWLKASIEKYKLQSGNTVETTLQDTSVVISEFQTASAAKSPPDIQYFWNGIYHMESVWLDYVEPLNGLIPDELLKASNATPLSIYKGKQYRLGWYSVPLLWIYNLDMFDKAGLNADSPPKTWSALLEACEQLKSKGFLPMTGGLKDGPWGEWTTRNPAASSDTTTSRAQVCAIDWSITNTATRALGILFTMPAPTPCNSASPTWMSYWPCALCTEIACMGAYSPLAINSASGEF